ncbi:MAG TPA: hypothetical protein DC054_14205 [Blastocatellia bacterium]|nr:hypothetical protein [Blastocatellia bacterium]
MSQGRGKQLEIISNVAIIVTAILLCILVARTLGSGVDSAKRPNTPTTQEANSSTINSRPRIAVGTKLTVEGVDWRKNRKTLVLALSDKCHFCNDSVPFYQQLAQNHGSAALVAVFPQPVDESTQYLNDHGVAIADVRQIALSSLAVSGTPTLILVDESGAVSRLWVGKLKPEREAEVVASLR